MPGASAVHFFLAPYEPQPRTRQHNTYMLWLCGSSQINFSMGLAALTWGVILFNIFNHTVRLNNPGPAPVSAATYVSLGFSPCVPLLEIISSARLRRVHRRLIFKVICL